MDPKFADANYLMALLLLRQQGTAAVAIGYLQEVPDSLPRPHRPALLALGEAQYLEHDDSAPAANPSRNTFTIGQIARKRRSRKNISMPYAEMLQADGSEPPTGNSDLRPREHAPEPLPEPWIPASPLPTSHRTRRSIGRLPTWTPRNWTSTPVAPAELDQVIDAVGSRAQELVQNVDRFTATEEIEHYNISPMGLQTSRETRKFDYLVEIHQVGKSDLDVKEYRNSNSSVAYAGISLGTSPRVGLPTLALIFHPYMQARYEFRCEGRGSWQGHARVGRAFSSTR